jgi:hypothetical protein
LHVFADSFFASLNLTSKKLFERTYQLVPWKERDQYHRW